MIVTKLEGGLGNQLFQYALGRCLAYKNHTELKLDLTWFNNEKESHHNQYKLSRFNVQEKFATSEEIENMQRIEEFPVNGIPGAFMAEVLIEGFEGYNKLLHGNWHSEQYFIEIEDIIRREFTLKNPLSQNSLKWKEKILVAKCAVSIQVRHGDYLNCYSRNTRGVLPEVYYNHCFEELRKSFSDITVFVFSDDLQWCKENLKFNVPTEFVEGCEHDFKEMHLISLCKHNIISNSTFSWWGAWLNQNPEKKVFAPYPWHRGGFGGETVFPKNWVKVSAMYHLSMPPLLSIILYVSNDFSTIRTSLESIISQFYRDYEVILVDASTDDSGRMFRQFALNSNVSILTSNHSTNKFSSWNKGLDVARGDYVLFLTCKEFVMSQMALLLRDNADIVINGKASGRDNYFTYATYDKHLPEIICFNKMLKEDENGSFAIGMIPNKKFSLTTDSALKGLNQTTELKLTTEQRLLGLATKGVNNFVTTKFFKRKFLNENHIRFNESEEAMDAELTFIVETFLKTKTITFVPNLFGGRLK